MPSTTLRYPHASGSAARRQALRHAVSKQALRDALHVDLSKAGLAGPLRVGISVGIVLIVGGLLGHRDLAGLAALGSLVSAFCRPDPYPIRLTRLLTLAAGITATIALGAAVGAYSGSVVVEIAVISVIAGFAAYLVSALHIVGPGAVIFVFAATAATGFAHTPADIGRATASTAIGAVIGLAAAMLPWFIERIGSAFGRATPPAPAGPQYETLWQALTGGESTITRHLLTKALRIAVSAALAATIAASIGLSHPMWAAMGGVAAMQGVTYHHTVSRGIARLLGNVGGALIAAALLALPLGYWGSVVGIVIFQIIAEVFSTVNYALCSLAVTPMALLLTGLGAGLSPEMAVDRILDTLIGIAVGIIVGALTVSGADASRLREQLATR